MENQPSAEQVKSDDVLNEIVSTVILSSTRESSPAGLSTSTPSSISRTATVRCGSGDDPTREAAVNSIFERLRRDDVEFEAKRSGTVDEKTGSAQDATRSDAFLTRCPPPGFTASNDYMADLNDVRASVDYMEHPNPPADQRWIGGFATVLDPAQSVLLCTPCTVVATEHTEEACQQEVFSVIRVVLTAESPAGETLHSSNSVPGPSLSVPHEAVSPSTTAFVAPQRFLIFNTNPNVSTDAVIASSVIAAVPLPGSPRQPTNAPTAEARKTRRRRLQNNEAVRKWRAEMKVADAHKKERLADLPTMNDRLKNGISKLISEKEYLVAFFEIGDISTTTPLPYAIPVPGPSSAASASISLAGTTKRRGRPPIPVPSFPVLPGKLKMDAAYYRRYRAEKRKLTEDVSKRVHKLEEEHAELERTYNELVDTTLRLKDRYHKETGIVFKLPTGIPD